MMILVKTCQIALFFLSVFVLWKTCQGLPDRIRLGGIFDTEDEEQELAFRIAVADVNRNPNVLLGTTLYDEIRRIQPNDSFSTHFKVCDVLQTGIAAVFGPQSQETSLHVRSMCDALEIPHVLFRWEYRLQRDDLSVNLYPHLTSTSRAFLQLVDTMDWKEFLYVYEEDQGALRLQDFLFEAEAKKYQMKAFQFVDSNYRDVFWDVKKARSSTADQDGVHHRIVLDVTRKSLYAVLKASQQVGMMTEKQAYIVTSLDLHTVDLEDFQFGKTNMTGLRLVHEENENFANLLEQINSRLNGYRRPAVKTLRTETVLIYDAVSLFANALSAMDGAKNMVAFAPIYCDQMNKGSDGTSLINFMKSTKLENGLTGNINFDAEGYRSHMELDVVHLTEEGLKKIGTMEPGRNVNVPPSVGVKHEFKDLEHKLYVVTTYLNPPYMMLKESSKTLSGNEIFEGFGYDLLSALADILKFRFQIREVADRQYGALNETTKKWSGMIGEIRQDVADMAIADLTINSYREAVVDFTMPFINTGISILYKKPTQKETSLFTFLLPFSGEVWIYVMGAYMAVSLILFVIGRLSPYEWSNPHPCRQNDQVEENCFSLLNSMWFTIGSLMQQGSDVAPTAPSTRTIASSWFFFNLIMISSYTANLASFLTVQNIVSPFETAEDLSKQEKIKYGCIPRGSTSKFFSNSTIATYQKMWKFMEKHQSEVFPKNSGDAKKMVLKGNYAFFTEAAWIEYITERECELTQVGGLLDSKAYGIAVKKNNTKLSEWLSGGILKLQEDGILHMLKERWWKQKRGGGKCAVVTSGSVTELGLGNVGGVFVVMMLGLTLAGIVTTLEFLWFSRKLEKAKDEPLLKMLLKELKFAVSCGDSEKPAPNLRKRKSSSRD